MVVKTAFLFLTMNILGALNLKMPFRFVTMSNKTTGYLSKSYLKSLFLLSLSLSLSIFEYSSECALHMKTCSQPAEN